MRLGVFILAGIELLMLVTGILGFWLAGAGPDAAGQGMALAYAILGTAAVILLLAPALLLAWHNKLPRLALALALLAAVFPLIVLVSA